MQGVRRPALPDYLEVRKCFAVHECGKALVATVLRDQTGRLEQVERVSVVPRGRSASAPCCHACLGCLLCLHTPIPMCWHIYKWLECSNSRLALYVGVRLSVRGCDALVSDVCTTVSMLSRCLSVLPEITWCNRINLTAACCLTPSTLSASVCCFCMPTSHPVTLLQ